MLNLSFPISAEDFDKDAFFNEMGVEDESEYVDDEGDIQLSLSFNDRKDSAKQHAHVRVLIRPDKSGTAVLNYHQTGREVPDKKPPYLEDCARWFSQFFKSDEQTARINATYEFGKDFAPTIPVPFPLVASNEALSGLKVSGLLLQYPEDASVDTVILQRQGVKTYLFIQKKSVVNLKEFDLFKELEEQIPTVDSLVKKQEESNGATQKKKSKARKKS